MPTTPPPAPALKTQPHGYFNQAQLEDIRIAGDLLTAVRCPPNTIAR